MKRIRNFLLLSGICFILTGCALGKPTIPLTEDETNAIAQYCAHLLMKHGASELYHDTGEKLLDKKEYEDAIAEREALLNPTSTPLPTATPVPENSDKGEEPTGQEDGDENTSTPVPTPSGKTTADASELFDPSVFEVSVSGYTFTKSFKSEEEYFALSAPSGKIVAVFMLDVKNISSQIRLIIF